MDLFGGSTEGGGEEEEEEAEDEEGGEATLQVKILPDCVISLEATDEFLCNRIMQKPESEIQVIFKSVTFSATYMKLVVYQRLLLINY